MTTSADTSQSTPDMWEHILTLMSVVVLSDSQLRDDEVLSFVNNTRVMAKGLDQNLEMSEEDLLRWFAAKRSAIFAKVNGPNTGAFIVENIMALDAFFHKETLLECLTNIAVSDAEFHEKEADIINLAAAYWELDI